MKNISINVEMTKGAKEKDITNLLKKMTPQGLILGPYEDPISEDLFYYKSVMWPNYKY